MTVLEIETPHGPANAHLHLLEAPRAGLVLGHGAGGGVAAPDLVAVTEAAVSEGIGVALVEQPYRVAGRRSPAPARQLDAAWTAVVERLAARELRGLALVVGGRSAGARVACRTAAATGAAGVLCLAFPLLPPRRAGASPAQSRLDELDAVAVPTLVVQGARDRFGIPPAGARRTVVEVSGDHSLRTDPQAVAAAVREWLPRVVEGVRIRPVAEIEPEATAAFREHRGRIVKLLPGAEIAHVGSTAVPGALTKGDVDLLVRTSTGDFDSAVRALRGLYAIHQPENWTATYASFVDSESTDPPVGVQLVVAGSDEDGFFEPFIAALTGDPQLLARYNALKLALDGSDYEHYTREKGKFVERVLHRRQRPGS